MNEHLHEIALKKEGHTYLFRFDPASRGALPGVLGRLAADAALNFSWHDAAVVCKKARQPCQRCGQSLLPPSVASRLK